MKQLLIFTLFFGQLIASDTIEVYTCYGNDRNLTIEGRVLNPREFHEAKQSDPFWINLWRKLGQIINDERKNVSVSIAVNKSLFTVKTDHEGYFMMEENFPPHTLHPHHEIKLFLTKEPQIQATCSAFIPSDRKQTGIISDFDDTVIISNVTHKARLIWQLLFKNYKQREAVAGMADRFQKILSNSPDKPLFFITGSPRQFHNAIQKFLDYHNFPKRTLITKKIHGKNPYALFAQHDYKSEQIEKLIALYPQVKWILFGDSGEADREIYLRLAQKYPGQIQEIYIRDVTNGKVEKVYPVK